MISAIPTTPLFRMEPPFEDMDGKKIRVIEGDRVSVGELRVNKRPKDRLFGLRIDILGTLDDAGRFTIRYVTLPEKLIRAIDITGETEVPYAVTIR